MQITLNAPFAPAGDQPKAIATLTEGLARGEKHQVLLGITGSGKTMTIAHVIPTSQRPTLVLAHNKTLAAQLFGELKNLFPQNCVEYFVSYFDYYQPEAYVPSSDTYIEKDSLINERIDKLRPAATRALLERGDVIIVASVSCIYGLGSPEAYSNMLLRLEKGQRVSREAILRKLVEIQYTRNDMDFHRGTFRARGDVIEIFPAHEQDHALRVGLWGDGDVRHAGPHHVQQGGADAARGVQPRLRLAIGAVQLQHLGIGVALGQPARRRVEVTFFDGAHRQPATHQLPVPVVCQRLERGLQHGARLERLLRAAVPVRERE